MAPTSPLPAFRFHPDPLGSGSVVASDVECRCCHQARGFIYTGPVYAEEELEDSLCPWCIADGSAHRSFDATFVDASALSDDAPEAAMTEIVERTPGFNSWQSESWPSCCGDPAAFVTPAGHQEIRQHYPQLEGSLMSFIVHDLDISGGAAKRMFASLQRDQSPTAYIFKCLHCDAFPVYIDFL